MINTKHRWPWGRNEQTMEEQRDSAQSCSNITKGRQENPQNSHCISNPPQTRADCPDSFSTPWTRRGIERAAEKKWWQKGPGGLSLWWDWRWQAYTELGIGQWSEVGNPTEPAQSGGENPHKTLNKTLRRNRRLSKAAFIALTSAYLTLHH